MATKPLTSESIAITERKVDMSLDDIIKMSKTNAGKSKKHRPSNKSREGINGKHDRSLQLRQYMDSRSTLRQGVLAQRRSNFQGKNFPLASDAARKAVVAPFRNGGFNRNRVVNWSRPRAVGPLRRQGNASTGSNAFKPQQQQHQQQRQQQRQHQHQHQQRQQQHYQQRQQPSQRGEMMPNQKPRTLDSLFANMKEQRMRAATHSTNNGNTVRGVNNQPRQPWLKGRFGNYRS